MKHIGLPHVGTMVTLFLLTSIVGVSCLAQSSSHVALNMTPVTPESVGFSTERLDRLHKLIQDEVDQAELAGAVTILARHGKVVEYRTYGKRSSGVGCIGIPALIAILVIFYALYLMASIQSQQSSFYYWLLYSGLHKG